jgi:predicted deacylase
MKPERAKPTAQKVRYSFLKILTGSDLSRRRLPLMAIESPKKGPVVWLAGCMHGDEVTGIITIQEVFKIVKKTKLLKGSLYAFPLMNPIGFEAATRNITLSSEDLNRSFPGDVNGSLAERIADRIFTTIRQTNPSLVLDLHNDWMQSIPYAVIDTHPGAEHEKAYGTAQEIARESGLLVLREAEALTKSFSYSMLLHDIPALTLELGESYVVNERNVECGVKSVLAILAHLGMFGDPVEPFAYDAPEAFRGKVLRMSDKPVSSASGIIRFMAKPGDVVRKGQPVARICNTFGKLQATMLSLSDGIVLGHSDSSVAFPGAPIMAFGVADTEANGVFAQQKEPSGPTTAAHS